MKKLTWWGRVGWWYLRLIPYIVRNRYAPKYPPPTPEEVMEFMQTGFFGGPIPLEPTCRGLTDIERARSRFFVGNPPDAVIQLVLDDLEADYRSSLKMHMGHRKPRNG